jgi:hypothetical protein
MWLKWFPWKFAIRKLARFHGFLDPIAIWSYFQNFAQPSEVAGPIELIRDSAVFHARGLINCRAIPQNHDWVWPYWINQQFNPNNSTYIPRAFSLTYVNLTRRNWTAVGQPDCPYYTIVDPAGLVTPHWDGWSVDFFILDENKNIYAPSTQKQTPEQHLQFDNELAVITTHHLEETTLKVKTKMKIHRRAPLCSIEINADPKKTKKLIVSLRPYNPEGISFVHQIKTVGQRHWQINNKDILSFNHRPRDQFFSEYSNGDVINNIISGREASPEKIKCKVGLATAAAVFDIGPGQENNLKINIPLDTRKSDIKLPYPVKTQQAWQENLNDYCKVNLPDKHKQFLYDTAVRSVMLCSNQKEVYPGPFTYKKFWFRDATFILYSMLCANIIPKVRTILETYPTKQKLNGYFQSQYGEWDSNGQALWIIDQYRKFTGRDKSPRKILNTVRKGADWIIKKCTDPHHDSPHSGLLPAGFSAEHFGPNDYYYWDDFWAVAGLQSAAGILSDNGCGEDAQQYQKAAKQLLNAIEASIHKVQTKFNIKSIPVSCNRRMDSAAIGSLACRYPAQIYSADDPRLLATADYIFKNHCFNNGFLLGVSHSGINAYLSLHLAQIFMQAGDDRFMPLSDEITALASPTGQWPEAIHPQTRGGCMGDGQHMWASAEWINFIRNSLLYEERKSNTLVIGAGIHKDWSKPGQTVEIGPAPTIFGTVNIKFDFTNNQANIEINPDWHSQQPNIKIRIPGFQRVSPTQELDNIIVKRGADN